MAWVKLNDAVEMWDKPSLGNVKPVEGKKFMALCVDPSSKNPYRGIARQVVERKGHEDIPRYLDRSKLVIVESDDLLSWRVVRNLEIKGLEKILQKLENKEKEFVGLEDPDILIGEDGKKHVYFTIPFKYHVKSVNDVHRYEVYAGHAEGLSLDNLFAREPVLGKFNEQIVGFKEICPVPAAEKELFLAETFVNTGGDKGYSAIGIAKAESLSGKWRYQKLVHDPKKEFNKWCAGHSSPCRIFDPDFLSHKKYLVGIMNGREQTKKLKEGKVYGKFRPGLFLLDNESEITWVAPEPLLEDPLATTITFASDFVQTSKTEGILYAHPDDSFVRAYKLNIKGLEKLLPKI